MEENKKMNPEGFEALLKQNEIAEAQKKALGKDESLESRIIKNAPKRESLIVRSLRTLQGDVEEGISRGKTTVVSVATAESHARKAKVIASDFVSSVKSEQTKKIASYVLGLILLISGSGGLYYVYMTKQNPTVKIEREESLIFTEQTIQLDIANISSNEILKIFDKESQKTYPLIGAIVEISPVKKTSLPENKTETKILNAEDFFKSFGLKPPARLIRSLESKFMLGINILSRNEPFLIFKITSYEIAFSDMIEWEKNMESDMAGFFFTKKDSAKIAATSSPSEPIVFKDIVFKNTDARELKNDNGKTLLIYAFPNKETLIISTNIITIETVINRLTTRKVVR